MYLLIVVVSFFVWWFLFFWKIYGGGGQLKHFFNKKTVIIFIRLQSPYYHNSKQSYWKMEKYRLFAFSAHCAASPDEGCIPTPYILGCGSQPKGWGSSQMRVEIFPTQKGGLILDLWSRTSWNSCVMRYWSMYKRKNEISFSPISANEIF